MYQHELLTINVFHFQNDNVYVACGDEDCIDKMKELAANGNLPPKQIYESLRRPDNPDLGSRNTKQAQNAVAAASQESRNHEPMANLADQVKTDV